MKVGKIRSLGILLCLLLLAAGLGMRFYASILSVSNYPLPTDWSEARQDFSGSLGFWGAGVGCRYTSSVARPGQVHPGRIGFTDPGECDLDVPSLERFLLFSTTILTAIGPVKLPGRDLPQNKWWENSCLPACSVGDCILFSSAF